MKPFGAVVGAAVLSGFLPLAARAADEGFVWIEGESARTRSVQRHGWYDSVKKTHLSGGDWLSNFGPAEGTAEYEFEVASAGNYAFWIGDAYFWFAIGRAGYDPTIQKWRIANPAILGEFPAAALLFRQGYVRKGEPVVREVRQLEDLWQRQPPRISEDAAFDPNREAGSSGRTSTPRSWRSPWMTATWPLPRASWCR